MGEDRRGKVILIIQARIRDRIRAGPKALPSKPSHRTYTFQLPHLNPNTNSNPSTSCSPANQPRQEITRAWLSSLPKNHKPTVGDIDAWIDSNQSALPLPEDFRSLPCPDLHQWLLSFHNPVPSPTQVEESGQVEFPYRFQRTDLWKPGYKWLESLDKDVIVRGREISESELLSANPAVMERLFLKHYNALHSELHLKVLKKRAKSPKVTCVSFSGCRIIFLPLVHQITPWYGMQSSSYRSPNCPELDGSSCVEPYWRKTGPVPAYKTAKWPSRREGEEREEERERRGGKEGEGEEERTSGGRQRLFEL
uniref:Uncharacterized protein LOC105048955 n=1 Tax=Elaeis guineensis var. tenera TaxID=51953 RepID=A0A8N4F751_ELAGV|nr:uncharacterized protein LOC105048955 [Elaeis guineensis]